jgi:hypothetical protein
MPLQLGTRCKWTPRKHLYLRVKWKRRKVCGIVIQITRDLSHRSSELYNTFWSLQLSFSKPTVFASKTTFQEFKEAVNKVMPFIKEATAKERAMMGSRSSAGAAATLKRKREPEEETNSNEYFFAKFLTSPDLLDLEVMLANELFGARVIDISLDRRYPFPPSIPFPTPYSAPPPPQLYKGR